MNTVISRSSAKKKASAQGKPVAVKQTAERFVSNDARVSRMRLSASFNRGAMTLSEASESAHSMATCLEHRGLLLRAPSKQ